MRLVSLPVLCGFALSLLASTAVAAPVKIAPPPHLASHGTTQQLIVDGKPFLILGGELANSSASSLDYLAAQWPALQATGLNTIFAPVEWDQLEPQQGHYDFTMTDGLIRQARQHHIHVVILWFGAWKNSMSTYAPPWVKHDFATYARAEDDKGQPQDILSPFDPDTLHADETAFAALLAHLKATDTEHTVLAVQVENEIGMLPVVRDYSPQAQAAFNGPVPPELTAYLKAHAGSLNPYVQSLWQAHGQKDAGTWSEVFGDTVEAQEVFQAWYFARFADDLARAGKARYPLPMYVNAALNRPGKTPGQYPSAGPLPHLFDVWKAAGPDIDLLAIDMYFPNFAEWADRYKRPDNPFFSPEDNQAGKPEAGANAFYAVGQLDAISFSPFAIDRLTPDTGKGLTAAYSVLKHLTPDILAAQGTGRMRGFRARVAYDGTVDDTPQTFDLGGYRFTVTFVDPWTPKDQQDIASHGGLIIENEDGSFTVAGSGVTVTFADPGGMAVGVERIVEQREVNSVWQPGRWLNGDESHQGRHLRLPPDGFGIQTLTLYKYR